MPNCVTDFSPFSMRIRPGKKREQISDKTRNPSMTGHSSTNSVNTSSRYLYKLLKYKIICTIALLHYNF